MRIVTVDVKEKAFEYYCMGLTSKEIGKLLNLSFRTVQNYMSTEHWKERREAFAERERKKIIRQYEKELKYGNGKK
jgi:uncharacterized protein YjcR